MDTPPMVRNMKHFAEFLMHCDYHKLQAEYPQANALVELRYIKPIGGFAILDIYGASQENLEMSNNELLQKMINSVADWKPMSYLLIVPEAWTTDSYLVDVMTSLRNKAIDVITVNFDKLVVTSVLTGKAQSFDYHDCEND